MIDQPVRITVTEVSKDDLSVWNDRNETPPPPRRVTHTGTLLQIGFDPGHPGTDSESGWSESFVALLVEEGGETRIVHIADGDKIEVKKEPPPPAKPLLCSWTFLGMVHHSKTWECRFCKHLTHDKEVTDKNERVCDRPSVHPEEKPVDE